MVPNNETQNAGNGKDGGPKKQISRFSHITGCWVTKYMCKACRGLVGIDDLPEIRTPDGAEARYKLLNELIKARKDKGKKFSLLPCLFQSVKGPLFLAILLTYISEALKFTQPFLIGTLVAYFAGNDVSYDTVYACAGGLVLVNFLFTFIFSGYSFLYQYTAMRMRIACVSAIFQKVVRLKISYTDEVDSGYILNLLTADTERFHTALVTFQGLAAGPVSLMALLLLLGLRVGVSALPAFFFLLVLFVVRMAIGRSVGKLRRRIAQWTDKRLQVTGEMLKRIKTIKMQSWEEGLLKKIAQFRKSEMRLLIRQMLCFSFNLVLGPVGIKITIALILITHHLLHQDITPQLVVEVVTWVHLSDHMVFTMLPLGLGTFYQLVESSKRVQFFLETDEIPADQTAPDINTKCESNECPGIKLEHVEANWRMPEPVEETQVSSSPLLNTLSRLRRDPSPRPTSTMYVTAPSPAGTPIVFPISPMVVAPTMIAASVLSQVPSLPVTPSSELSAGSLFPSMEESLDNQAILADVSLSIPMGELVVILGGVGSGKTSLLMAILGFLPVSRGRVEVGGRVAYVPQEAWLINDTLEVNILMGKVKDEERYKKVIKACQLEEDLLQFPEGDQTVVGESSVTLSGGQKSRVNLARAVYQDADIYLLDDPLSALDVSVGKKIYDLVICGLLKDKCRVLVTHQLHLVQGASRVIILEDGRITETGAYNDVAKKVDLERTVSRDSAASSASSYGGSKWSILKVAFRMKSPTFSRMSSSISYRSEVTPPLPEKDTVEEPALAYSDVNELEIDPDNRSVSLSVYLWYLKAGFGQFMLPLIFILTICTMGSGIFADYFATQWADNDGFSPAVIDDTANITNITNTDTVLGDDHSALYLYMAIVTGYIAGCFIQSICLAWMVWFSARNIHNKLQTSVINAPMTFFERNTFGAILNRFSRDTGFVDERFIIPTFLTVGLSCNVGAYLVYATFVNFYVVLATIPFFILTLVLRQTAIYAIRDFKRTEVKLKSPVLAHISAILDGIPVIRAFKLEQYMLTTANRYIDRHSQAWYSYLCAQRWLQLNLLLLTTAYLAVVIMLAISTPSEVLGGGALGLSLTYIISMMTQIQEVMKWSTEIESYMTSVERLRSFSDLEPECTIGRHGDLDNWPSQGQITFSDVTMTYSTLETPTLDNLNFTIKPGEKVGIVGRTGAGKSSLFAAILRLQESEGCITIDDVSITDIPVRQLRQAISAIPQDPVIMRGTLRETLDPSQSLSEEKLWKALEKVEMKERVEQLTAGLDFEVYDGAYEFSVGQRQLLCLARALLRNTKIVIIDEATANVDERTYAQIEQAVREQTATSTVLNIAHHLNTIITYDRVMVLEKGRVVELDHPHVLLQNSSGKFRLMVQQSGKDSAVRLTRKAYLSYKRKNARES